MPQTMSEPAPKILSPEYYERLAAAEQQHPWTRAMRRMSFELLRRAEIGSGDCPVLDAGCGTGLFLKEWPREFPRARTTGLDLSLAGLRTASRLGVERLLAASTDELPLRPHQFQAVVCHDVVQHLTAEQAQRSFRECARVLRAGGCLVIRTAARRGIGSKTHEDSTEYRQWEPETLRAALEREGFTILFLSKVNFVPAVLADVKGLFREQPRGDVGLSLGGRPEPGWKAAMLEAYWSLERTLVLRMGWRPRRGHTLFCLARREVSGASIDGGPWA